MIQASRLEKELTSLRPQPVSDFSDQLYEQAVNQYVDTYQAEYCRKKISRHYTCTAIASAIMVLVIIFVFTPPGQVLAQKIFQFGWFIFTDDPPKMEQLITVTPDNVVPLQSSGLDVQAASELAGFPVYSLTHIPDGYQLLASNTEMPVDVVFNQAGQVTHIQAMYVNRQTEQILSFTQISLPANEAVEPIQFPVGDAEPEFVQVGASEGIWLENFVWGVKADESGDMQTVPYNLLIWQMETEDGQAFQFWLGSEEQLPLDVMLQMANSIE